ncbi:DNA polymerase III subunit alpha [Staphylococcus felis]|uniref:DNA polymerase III subunit alpha n=1 Tax=Staphylococcus felis TaxID=46127 RepID=UPI000E25DBA8|nr:DNA polymerase III subunit alpha [Staphylococcus felis]REH87060.1 DNA polymerase III subunit alpha [Staphylococcus felis]
MVAHLNIHTAYDLLNSTLKVEDAVKRAKSAGYSAVAITDLHVMYGVPQFYDACVTHQIKPLLGMTVHITDEFNQMEAVILAKNNEGLKYLFKLSSDIKINQRHVISIHHLKKYLNHHIVIFKQFSDQYSHWLDGLSDDTSVYIDQLSSQFEHLKKVWIKSAHYGEPDEKEALKVLEAIRENQKVNFVEKKDSDSAHILTVQELLNQGVPQALLAQTDEIADLCDAKLNYHQSLLPEFVTPNNETSDEYLWYLLNQALQKLDMNDSRYKERMTYEFNIIRKMGYSDYFLIVSDLIHYAKSNHIMVGPGRGSSAGSLVSYLLNITTIDPIKYDLLFERFLNPERVTMPDIDIDFEDTKREKVIQYVQEKYGDYRVAGIITFGHLSAKAVARDVGRVMGFDEITLSEASKNIPSQLGITLEEAYQHQSFQDFVHRNHKHEHWFELCKKLEGLPRNTSTHAAGIIINDQPLDEFVPLTEGDTGLLTQWTMTESERIGLLKIDFLGLRNLSIIHEMIKQIQRYEGVEIDIEKIPLDDSHVFELLSRGDTTGIFQLESEGVRKVLQNLQPEHFEDIVAVTSLYRPGPMEEIPTYIKRRHHPHTVSYLHTDLEPLLKRTYGVIVYQEQIMQIASQFAGFSYGEADILRRAMSKKNRAVLENERQHFIDGAYKRGYSERLSQQIFDLILKFADYGFPRAHAVSYSKIAYIMSYLKVHYPTYFYANILSNVIGHEEKTLAIIDEAKTHNINIHGPHINKSMWRYVSDGNNVYISLGAIKGVGYQSVNTIVKERLDNGPFKDLFDFCDRIPSRIRSRRLLEPLILTGALDCFGENRATLLQSIDKVIDTKSDLDQSFLESFATTKRDYQQTEEMPDQELSRYEKQYMGFYVSTHPVEKLFNLKQYLGIYQLNPQLKFKPVLIYLDQIRVIRTKKGQQMAFVELNDGQKTIEGVIFPNVYQKISFQLNKGVAFIVKGKFERRHQNIQMIINDIEPLESFENNVIKRARQIIVRVMPTPTLQTQYLQSPCQKGLPVYYFDEVSHTYEKIGCIEDDGEKILAFIAQFKPEQIRVLSVN